MNQQQITSYYNNRKSVGTLMKDKNVISQERNMNTSIPDRPENGLPNTENDVIDLVSSDEGGALSDDSDATILIFPRTPTTTKSSDVQIDSSETTRSETPQPSPDLNSITDLTPQIELPLTDTINTQIQNQSNEQSPSTSNVKKSATPTSSSKRKRFFSPVKKRNMVASSPTKIKRNLASMFEYESDVSSSPPQKSNTYFNDIKTTFLLDAISECLDSETMKNLLDEDDQKLLQGCRSLPPRGLRVVCRLYWRRDGWFRKNKVVEIIKDNDKHVEDVEIELILKSLIHQNFLRQGTPEEMSIQDFIRDILKTNDLKDICKQLKIKTQKKTKQDLEDSIKEYCKRTTSIASCFSGNGILNNSRRVLQIMGQLAGLCYKLPEKCKNVLYKFYLLTYLGINYDIIRDKNLEFMLLNADTQKQTFPLQSDIKIDNAGVVFENRQQFERYLLAHGVYEEFFSTKEVEKRCAIVKQVYGIYKNLSKIELERYKSMDVWLRWYTPGYIYVKILCEGLIDLKKGKDVSQCELAVKIIDTLLDQELFRQHKKAKWYDEKALILHTYLRRSDEAAQVLLEGFSSNLSDEEKDAMRLRAKLLASLKNITLDTNIKRLLLAYAVKETTLESSLPSKHIQKHAMENQTKGKIMFETRLQNERVIQGVEEFALDHYIHSGEFTHGSHWEGRMVVTLFALLFWDIIYSPGVRGVFLSPYQQVPLDMYTDSFYANRKTLIDNRLKLIENENIKTLLECLEINWNSRPENELSLVNRSIGLENMTALVSCLGSKRVHALCRRLARRFHYAHSGFPDLTLWNVHNKKVKFVEVKSDSDSPSMKQIQWMQYLIANGIDTEFCYVGTKTNKKSRQNSFASDAS